MKKVDKEVFESWKSHSFSQPHHVKYIDGKAVKAVILCIDDAPPRQSEPIDTIENGIMKAASPCHIFGFASYSRVERLVRFEGESTSDCLQFQSEPVENPRAFLKDCVIPRMGPSNQWMYGMVHIEIDNSKDLTPDSNVKINGEVLMVWNNRVEKDEIPSTDYTILLSP